MSERSLTIGDVRIEDASDCYVIAEIGHNHQGSLEQAKRLFAEAKSCGADAVKVQKRDNRSLYTQGVLRQALRERELVRTDVRVAPRGIGVRPRRVRGAARLRAGDRNHVLRDGLRSAQRRLPRRPRHARVQDRVGRPHEHAAAPACRLDRQGRWCSPPAARDSRTSSAPSRWRSTSIRRSRCSSAPRATRRHGTSSTCSVIATYRDAFPDTVVGLSSHDNGIAMAVAAFALGARIVEKHFTLDRSMRGTDHSFSLEPQGLRKMVRDLRRVRAALGDGDKRRFPERSRAAREDEQEARGGTRPAGGPRARSGRPRLPLPRRRASALRIGSRARAPAPTAAPARTGADVRGPRWRAGARNAVARAWRLSCHSREPPPS